MKTIIAGSRSITEYDDVLNGIENSGIDITEVFSGMAIGVDKLGERYAKENNIVIRYYPANWTEYGKSAGYRRNVTMGEAADAAIIVWDGVSKGSKHMIDIMKQLDKPYYVHIPRYTFEDTARLSWK